MKITKADFEKFGLYKDYVSYIGSSRPASCTMTQTNRVNLDYIFSKANSPEPTIFEYDFEYTQASERKPGK